MSTTLWNVQIWDQTLGTYTNPTAAKAHGEYAIRTHYRHSMNRYRVPESDQTVDWRARCCGHLLGPGKVDQESGAAVHAPQCDDREAAQPVLYPFWAMTGTRVGTGHVSTAWEIWQGVAHDVFEEGRAA